MKQKSLKTKIVRTLDNSDELVKAKGGTSIRVRNFWEPQVIKSPIFYGYYL